MEGVEKTPRDKGDTTVISTKANTFVFVRGRPIKGDWRTRHRAGDEFVNNYNKDFTAREQKQIGNVWYNVAQNPGRKVFVADSTYATGKQARQLNPHHDKMAMVRFRPIVRNDESTICHEMIHAQEHMRGKFRHSEHKTDFETVGRITLHGLKAMRQSYYFSPAGNPVVAKMRKTNTEKGRIATAGVKADRILLTGSLSHRIIGQPIKKRVDTLFPKSYFRKRKFS